LIKNPFWSVKLNNGKTYHCYLPDDTRKIRAFLNHNRNRRVSFILIDEFSHPELFKEIAYMEGRIYAKLIDLSY
jgi:hypothetical protein